MCVCAQSKAQWAGRVPRSRASAVPLVGGLWGSRERGNLPAQSRCHLERELPEAPGQHMLCLLVSPITNAGHQDLAPESSVCLTADSTGFLPIPFNSDIIGLTGTEWTSCSSLW